MYSEEKNKSLNIKDLIIKIIFLALFIFLLVWLFPKVPNMKPFYSNVFRENISYMQDAAESYFTEDKLPIEVGDSVKISLKEMQEENLILPFVDEEGNSCNIESSYAQITKNEKGYILKTNLECNTEKDYVTKILGCNQYCTDGKCESSTTENTCGDKQYQYRKAYGTKKVTSYTCPSGYSREGKYCYKTLNSDKINATPIYTKDTTLVVNALKNPGTEVKVELSVISKTTPDTYSCAQGTLSGTKCISTINATKNVTGGERYTYNTLESYTFIEYENCNCKTQTVNTCASISGCYNYVDKTVCAKCPIEKTGTRTVERIGYTDTVTTYTCPSGYSKDGTTCTKVTDATIKKGNTIYSCPIESTSQSGSNTTLKCYKTTTIEGNYYCQDSTAKLEESSKTCSKIIKGELSGYKCPNSKYILDGTTCYIKSTDKKNATKKVNTITIYKYKWSCKSSLEDGWKKTGKTR